MMDYSRLTPAVERAAAIAISSFPEHHDVADVRQELWVWALENKGTVNGILRDSDGADTALVELLVKAANSHLKKEDAAVYCYDEEDQFYYSIDLIKSILEVVFRHEDWVSFATALDAMPKVKADPSHSGNNLASYSDVKSAVESLPDDQYNVLVWRYKYQYTYEAIGAEFGSSKEAARQRLNTAHAAVQRSLGKRDLGELRRPSRGPSRPNTGAAARARTEHDYEG
jgi:RNA polymerase sigma factor (sigma-70 family)